MSCQKCVSKRLIEVHAKAKDLHTVSFAELEHDGYLPFDLGIGGGDYIDLIYCVDCGHIQGEWPLPETGMERGFPVGNDDDDDDEHKASLPANGVIVVCAEDKEVFKFDKNKGSDVTYFERGKLQVIQIDEVSEFKARGFYIDKAIK